MNHAWRPLFVVIGIVILILAARAIIVPSDFMAKNGNYKYQWHRISNEEEWKNFQVKYQGRDFCGQCHPEQLEQVVGSKHAKIQCENCHVQIDKGKAVHPIDLEESFQYPLNIGIDRSRVLCLRCHAELPYRPTTYVGLESGPIPLKMQNPEKHNPGIECTICHNSHVAGVKMGG